MDPTILKELQQLVAANVISEDTANSIKEYYRLRKAEPTNRFAIVLGILGALLVGLGIVLVIAHNWDSFDRVSKTIFAFLPLVLGQGLCLYTLAKRRENFVWRESSGVILFFGIGACISLTSQIYHLGGTLSDLLLFWMLLAAPLIYVLPSHIVSLLYIAGVTWYAFTLGYSYSWDDASGIPYLYVPLMLVVLPAYLKLMRRDNNLFILHNWFAAVSFAFVLGTFSENNHYQWVFLGYLSLACVYYLIGMGKLFDHRPLYANPFLLLAMIGIVCILLGWTYQFAWTFDIFDQSKRISGVFPIVLGLLFLLATAMLIRRYIRKEWSGISPVEFSGYVFLVAILFQSDDGKLSTTLMNLWVLMLGLYFTRKGSIRHHLGILNLGLLIIAALAVLRFFDDEIPFVWRGIFFLATGIAFFVANYVVIKRKKSLAIIKDQQA